MFGVFLNRILKNRFFHKTTYIFEEIFKTSFQIEEICLVRHRFFVALFFPHSGFVDLYTPLQGQQGLSLEVRSPYKDEARVEKIKFLI